MERCVEMEEHALVKGQGLSSVRCRHAMGDPKRCLQRTEESPWPFTRDHLLIGAVVCGVPLDQRALAGLTPLTYNLKLFLPGPKVVTRSNHPTPKIVGGPSYQIINVVLLKERQFVLRRAVLRILER